MFQCRRPPWLNKHHFIGFPATTKYVTNDKGFVASGVLMTAILPHPSISVNGHTKVFENPTLLGSRKCTIDLIVLLASRAKLNRNDLLQPRPSDKLDP
jgi:hypothetical protein